MATTSWTPHLWHFMLFWTTLGNETCQLFCEHLSLQSSGAAVCVPVVRKGPPAPPCADVSFPVTPPVTRSPLSFNGLKILVSVIHTTSPPMVGSQPHPFGLLPAHVAFGSLRSPCLALPLLPTHTPGELWPKHKCLGSGSLLSCRVLLTWTLLDSFLALNSLLSLEIDLITKKQFSTAADSELFMPESSCKRTSVVKCVLRKSVFGLVVCSYLQCSHTFLYSLNCKSHRFDFLLSGLLLIFPNIRF